MSTTEAMCWIYTILDVNDIGKHAMTTLAHQKV